jgi:hypothetical protein
MPKGRYEPPNPPYPDLGEGVAKYRRKANGSIYSLSRAERVAWADAIERAIRAKQRAALQREAAPARTFYPVGEALRRAHRARLLACPAQIRREREPEEWIKLYKNAMGWTSAQVHEAIDRQRLTMGETCVS